MNQSITLRLPIVLALLFGVMLTASAADRFYVDAVNFEPGESKTILLCLDNDQDYYGFQADLTLPEGLSFVTQNGKPVCTLSSRANASYTTISNLRSETQARLGTFSTDHTALSGNSGALMYVTLQAADDFSGGNLSLIQNK